MNLPPEKLETYKATARRRAEERRAIGEIRTRRARELARRAAALLKEEYGATRVVVFGSLADERPLGLHADVDLAAWDLPKDRYFEAVARMQDLSSEFSIDLVAMEMCPEKLRKTIHREGVEV